MDLRGPLPRPPTGFELAAHDPGRQRGVDKEPSRRASARRTSRGSTSCRSSSTPRTAARCWSSSRRWTPPARTARSSTSWAGVNPQGVRVTSFKQPTVHELAHDWLWRCQVALPMRGEIGIFNRSHYEEVVVLRVHPEYLAGQAMTPRGQEARVLGAALEDIAAWERHLHRSGTRVLKFFLHVSRAEQRQRFLAARGARQALEVLGRRRRRARALGRLPGGLRRRAEGDQHRARAVVRDPGRPQVAHAHRGRRDPRPPPRGHGPAVPDALRRGRGGEKRWPSSRRSERLSRATRTGVPSARRHWHWHWHWHGD